MDEGIDAAVVVPARPGALVTLPSRSGRRHDEVDEVVDELFGEPDERGPSAADVVLLFVGLVAAIAGVVAERTWLVVVGAAAFVLGSVLPARSMWRRVEAGRAEAQRRRLVGDGQILRIDHADVDRLVGAHARVLAAARAPLRPEVVTQAQHVAHAAAAEVASLLAGRTPATAPEREYVRERARSLGDLAAALEGAVALGGDPVRQQAAIEARREVERLTGGSSVTEAAQLVRELGGPDAEVGRD